MTQRVLFLVAGLCGALGVVLSASAAHGLEAQLSPKEIGWVDTAGLFLLLTAPAIALCARLSPSRFGRLPWIAGLLLTLGVILFSGALTGLAFFGFRSLGAVAPIGGLSLILGWLCLGASALTSRQAPTE